ncbi:YaaC family protein [Streptomyces dangxiongensis]|uniref:YaaC family protein n=1 Tax=Streptomyces dangxiongensis TaxID=1442032 RepID=UPI0026A86920
MKDIQQTWRSLRSLRSAPPAPVRNSGRRKEVFSASLEQSEQYFRAAEAVGYETRPVLIFYGLSQMGRAIAAATHVDRCPSPEDWQLSGHGIRVPGISQAAAQGDIGRLTVRDQGKGAFTQLARFLDSPSLPTPVQLSEVWDSIPEMGGRRLSDGEHYPALEISEGADRTREDWGDFGPPRALALTGVPRGLPSLGNFLKRYPTVWPLEGLQESSFLGSPRGGLDGQIYLNPLRKYAAGGFAALHGTRYRGRSMAFPALTGNSLPLHPLLTWWAVLYVLSMLARYEPAAWATTVNVDASKQAVPIEYLLDEALDAVPTLALEIMSECPLSDHERRQARANEEEKYKRKEYRTFSEIGRSMIADFRHKSPLTKKGEKQAPE